MKTSNDKFVGQSVSYEITERYRTESVSFHLKYWLKLTYPVVAAVTIPWSRQRRMLPNYVMSKIECGQLHSELFGRRHSTLQSHGLFALAKHLYFTCNNGYNGVHWCNSSLFQTRLINNYFSSYGNVATFINIKRFYSACKANAYKAIVLHSAVYATAYP